MKRFALTTAIALGLAAPAFANDQLAASLGVEPGVYSTAELVTLRTAMEDGNEALANFILDGGSETVSTQSFGISAGHQQLADALGVDAADYSVAELVTLRDAIENDNEARVNFILSGGSETVSTQSFGTSADQFAASIGVDAADFSAAQLILLRAAMEDGDERRVTAILNGDI